MSAWGKDIILFSAAFVVSSVILGAALACAIVKLNRKELKK